MRPRLPLAINGIDFSAAASRLAYTIVYNDRTGGNERLMLSGDRYFDILDRRPTIVWELNALWADELAALHAAINAADVVPVLYYDTATNAPMTGYFHGTIGTQVLGLYNSRGMMFHGPVLTLESR